MEERPGWTALAQFGSVQPEPTRRTSDGTPEASDALVEFVRDWELDRLEERFEWSLVVLESGACFERQGREFVATFDGFSAEELRMSVLSHTHVRGFPPSNGDIELFLELPEVSLFRVARKGHPTVLLKRIRVVGRVEAAVTLSSVRRRAVQRAGPNPPVDALAGAFWEELQEDLDALGIEWKEVDR